MLKTPGQTGAARQLRQRNVLPTTTKKTTKKRFEVPCLFRASLLSLNLRKQQVKAEKKAQGKETQQQPTTTTTTIKIVVLWRAEKNNINT